ncbi:MAG: glutamine synthetase type III, partial [Anaerobutyricum hallii]
SYVLLRLNRRLAKRNRQPSRQKLWKKAQNRVTHHHDVVFTAMDELRKPADKLEMLVAKSAWPFPSYGDLIFEV